MLLERDDYLLLRQIVRFRDPALLPLIETGSLSGLAAEDTLALRAIIEQEYDEFGRGEGELPSPKGHILGDLLSLFEAP